eukprot:scaffold168160_cov27-Tisochrysis_lutea.AAC.1
MAWRCVSPMPICQADCAELHAMTTPRWTKSGYITSHSRACIPPSEPPITAETLVTPRCSRSMRCSRTVSRTVTIGKSARPRRATSTLGPVLGVSARLHIATPSDDPRRARGRHLRDGPSRAIARAKHIGADDKVLGCVDGPSLPKQRGPPLIESRVARESVSDKEDVVCCSARPAPRAVGDVDSLERDAALERERGDEE